MEYTLEKYHEWKYLPDYTIINDPDNHDCENSNNDYYYTDDLLANTPHGIIVVKSKRVVNGASIPWLAQCIIPKSGKYNRPSAFHDVGFEDGGFWILQRDLTFKFKKLPQKSVDYTYLKLMGNRGVPKWNRYTQYHALRMGGWIKWNKYRKQDK
jgi:hypothetical protein